jgi:hypothetical protein
VAGSYQRLVPNSLQPEPQAECRKQDTEDETLYAKHQTIMNDTKKLQRWLGIGAILFVLVYIGAVYYTIQSRGHREARSTVIESARAMEQERNLLLPELLLPMGILLMLAGCYLIVRHRNQKTYQRLDDDVEDGGDDGPGSDAEM